MRVIVLAVAGLAALVLASCQTMTAEECAAADWGALGYADGSAGDNRFSARQESCAKKGFAADYQSYATGHAEGLRAYCTPYNGFQRGLRGSGYSGFCPADLGGVFAQAYGDGYRAYEVRSARDQAQAEQSRLESRRRDIENDIQDNEDALRTATTDADRARLRNEIGRLNDEHRRVNDDLRTQLREVRWRADSYERVRYEIGDRWGAW